MVQHMLESSRPCRQHFGRNSAYVLWDDNGKPLAVVEAKKTQVDARAGQEQAKLYADALEKIHGQRPMIFYTNGHDIWVWDDAGGYPPRSVFGFFSKDTLQYRVGFQRREKLDLLNDVRPDANIAGRLYQIESITRVVERFSQRHRRALVVQATGTGKTRVAIALAKLLIDARWVKRVLFLCDRKELRKQAKNAFNDFVQEPIYVIGQANDVGKMDARIYIGIHDAARKDVIAISAALDEFGMADMATLVTQAKARMQFLDELEELARNPATREAEMHKAIERNLWILGPTYTFFRSNQTLKRTVEDALGRKYTGDKALERPDLLLNEDLNGACLLIEFKRPSHPLNHDDYIQAISYRHELRKHMNKPIKVLVMGGGRSSDFPDERREPDVEVATFADAIASARRSVDWQLSVQAGG